MKRETLALAIWLGLAVAHGRAEGKPHIEFDKTVYDFGASSEGASITGKFSFRNAGDGVLNVQKPDPSCGCTVAQVQPDTLPPGAKGELVFTLDLTNARGAVEKHITVPSNDPAFPELLLTIKGQAKALYDFDPPMIFLDGVAAGQTSRAAVNVKRLDGKKLTITKVEPGTETLKVVIDKEDALHPQAARFGVEVAGTGVSGDFSDILSVYTDDPAKPAFLVPAAGRFLSSIVLAPQAVDWTIPDATHWPASTSKEAVIQKIIVTSNRSDKPLELGDIASTLEDLLVKVTELEKGRKFEVTLKLDNPLKESTRGRLTCETNYPEQPSLEVPLTIRVAAP